VRGVARRGNPRLVIDKIVINRWRGHNEHRVRETELRNAFGDLVARTMIPELAAVSSLNSSHVDNPSTRNGNGFPLASGNGGRQVPEARRTLRPSSIQAGRGPWLGQCMRQAAVVPHPPGRAPPAGCGGHVRPIVSLRQLAAQQGVQPDIGTPPVICTVWLRLETRRRMGRGR
jgi:hypothetical protein